MEIYVPLAIGNHVDHQLTLEAGRMLAQADSLFGGMRTSPTLGILPGTAPSRIECRILVVALLGLSV